MALAAAGAPASAGEPFSIRGFAARMRSVDAAKCYPFGGGGCREGDGEPPPPPQLPPMDPTPRSRWWAHELASERARLAAAAAGGEEAAGGSAEDAAPRKGTKRKGPRGSTAAAERAKRRRRALQLRTLLKNKEKASMPQSISRLHQHMMHIGLLRKHRSSSIHTRRELAPVNGLEEIWDHTPTLESSLNEGSTGGMHPSNGMHSSLLKGKAAKSFVNKRSIKVSESTNYHLNPGCEGVKHAAHPPKDDIFGDLPALESSNIMFRTSVDELPTVIEESLITDQSGPDAIPETLPLKLIHASDITAQTPSPLEDLVKIEEAPDKESACISQDDAASSQPSPAGLSGLSNDKRISMVKTCNGDVLLKDIEPACISQDAARSQPSPGLNGLRDHQRISLLKTCNGHMQRKYTDSACISQDDARSQPSPAGLNGLPNHMHFSMVKLCDGEMHMRHTDSACITHGDARIQPAPAVLDDLQNHKRISTVKASNGHMRLKYTEQACVVAQDSARSQAGLNVPPNHSCISMVKPCNGVQLEFTNGSALNSYSDLRLECGSSNPQQGYFDTNRHCHEKINKHGTSSAASSSAVRTRSESTKGYNDAADNDKKSTNISGPVVAAKKYHSSERNLLHSAITQGVDTRTNSDGKFSCRSMPAKECIPPSRPSGNFASNLHHRSRNYVDGCESNESQDSWHSKLHPVCSPSSIGLAFMKLPGLERMEISSCNPKTGENKFTNEQSMDTVKHQKQKLVSGTTNIMQGQKNIGFSNSLSGKTVQEGYVGQDFNNLQQPTVRLMGKTVSVCKRNKDHCVPTIGKVCADTIAIEENHPSSISSQFPQMRLFPCQGVIPDQNDPSDFSAMTPNSTLSEGKTTFNGLPNQRLQPIRRVSSTIKGCTWNFGGQFVHQVELNKASMVSANSETRHTGLQQPRTISIPQNQQYDLSTPASRMSRVDHNFVGPTVNQSYFPQEVLRTSMKEKYQNSTLLSCDDPSSVPIRQPDQIPGAKLLSAPAVSFFDYGGNNALSRNSSPGLCSSLTTNVSYKPVPATGLTSTGNLTNTDGRKRAGFADQINNVSACADNDSQQPAKRQLVTERKDFMFMAPNKINHSLGWSLNDALGPRVLDFSNRVAGDAVLISRNEKNNLRASSGRVPAVETGPRAGLVVGAKTMLKPGQDLTDHSKLPYSTKFSVDTGINSVVL
ncbi:hypothetical protein ACP70R_036849 [Stipagrostis hirtigluma subsp. patula]